MFTGAKIPSSSPSHIVNSQDESSISRKRKLVDKSSCSKVKRPNLNSSDDEFVDNSSFYSNGNRKLVVHKSCNIVSSKSSKVVDKAFAFNKVVEKKNQETSIKSFDFVLNKPIEDKTTNTKNDSFDFVLERNYILKDKKTKNKSSDVNANSGSSSEYLVNRRFEGVLKGCSSERNGFEESTAMDSGSTNDNGITAMDNGSTNDNGITAMDSGSTNDNGITAMDSGSTNDNGITAMDSGSTIDNGISAMDSGSTIDNGSTAMDSGSNKPSKTKLNSFGLVLNVDKNYKETSIKSFDFVLNKSIEVKTTDAKNNSFDFVLDRNYILKDKINKNKSLDVNISGSSSEYLVNRRFEGVLKGCSSERNGFEESTAMDSGSTNDNGITAMDNGMEEVDWIKDLGKGIAEDDEEFYSGDDFVQTKFEDSRLSNIKKPSPHK